MLVQHTLTLRIQKANNCVRGGEHAANIRLKMFHCLEVNHCLRKSADYPDHCNNCISVSGCVVTTHPFVPPGVYVMIAVRCHLVIISQSQACTDRGAPIRGPGEGDMRLAGAGPIVGVTLIIVTKLLSRSQITLEFSCILPIVILISCF